MFQYDEHEQNLQGDCRHGEEVKRNVKKKYLPAELKAWPRLAGI
jgi:hypothetical protein